MRSPHTVFLLSKPFCFFPLRSNPEQPTPPCTMIFLRAAWIPFLMGNPHLSEPPVIKNSYPGKPNSSPETASPMHLLCNASAAASFTSFWIDFPSFVPNTNFSSMLFLPRPKILENHAYAASAIVYRYFVLVF